VAYTIAKLELLIAEQANGKVLNTQNIWKNQTMSPALRSQLQIIAETVYSAITSPDKGFENISEWAKKELAWQRISQRELQLSTDLKSELISFGENAERKAIATSNAKIDVGFAAVSEVLTYKCSGWKILRQWGLDRQELTPKEDQLLLLASTLGKIPTDRQAAAILLIQNRLMEEGFVLS
jgi:hypothetical protein